jgi:hypothetical protein
MESIPFFDPKEWIEDAIKSALMETTLAEVAQSITEQVSKSEPVQVSIGENTGTKLGQASIEPVLPHWHAHSTITGQKLTNNTSAPIVAQKQSTKALMYHHTEDLKPKVQTLEQDVRHNVDPNIMVSVKGIKVPIKDITQNELDDMTGEEYEEYYYIVDKNNK